MDKNQDAWFKQWFDSKYYHILYKHRDYSEARKFIKNLVNKLQIPPGASILDLGCGNGRHAIQLAKMGYQVTGIDISPNNIAMARSHHLPNANFMVHDMRIPVCKGCFDYVFNFFTSFGYFDNDSDHQQTIDSISTALKKGGYCVIDYLNAIKTIHTLVPHEVRHIEGITFDITRKIEDGYVIKQIRFYADGQQRVAEERVRLFTPGDFKKMFMLAGLTLTDMAGDYDLQPFQAETSPRLILIAKKGQ